MRYLHGRQWRAESLMLWQRCALLNKVNASLAVLCVLPMACSGQSANACVSRGSSVTAASCMTDHELVEVWVVLSVPALATLPRAARKERAALRQRIVEQQDRVMRELQALGAVESGRTQQTSNAIAVTVPAAAVQDVKNIDGVITVRPVSQRHRIGAA